MAILILYYCELLSITTNPILSYRLLVSFRVLPVIHSDVLVYVLGVSDVSHSSYRCPLSVDDGFIIQHLSFVGNLAAVSNARTWP